MFRAKLLLSALECLLALLLSTAAAAQASDSKKKKDEPPPLPNDQRLLALHREFVLKAEKLANEYERAKQTDKAAAVYGEILKLVPAYAKARDALDKIHERELSSNRVVFEVMASKDWQDTGIRVVEGKPVRLTADGTWTFNLSQKIGPEGMQQMPEKLKDFPLGSLIGVIAVGDRKKIKPFLIGQRLDLEPEQSGPLLVRMHDIDSSDNQGRMMLEITGRFERK